MRHDRISGIADQAEHLPEFDAFAGMYLDAAWLHVGIERVAVVAEIENDAIPVGIGEGDVLGVSAGSLFGLIVDDGRDDSVCDGERGLTKDGVALELFARAGVDGAFGVELFPIHGVALRYPDASVDRHRGAGMAHCVTTGVRGDVSRATERWADLHRGFAVYSDRSSGFRDIPAIRRGCACQNRDAMRKVTRNSGARSEDDV